jgi:hypothetical protein
LPILSTAKVRTWPIFTQDRFGRPGDWIARVRGNPAR